MARRLLDTNIVIDYLRGRPAIVAAVRDYLRGGDVVCTCAVVMAEVFAGASPRQAAVAREFLASCEFLVTTPQIGVQAGTWRYAYARSGIALATADTIIAATARFHDATLVTLNQKDFPMPELTIATITG